MQRVPSGVSNGEGVGSTFAAVAGALACSLPLAILLTAAGLSTALLTDNMDFVQATDQLMAAGITLQEMAEALGVAHNTVRVARLDPASSSYRRPPAEWRAVLARLARRRGGDLLKLADKIEKG